MAETEIAAARLLLLHNLGNTYVELRYCQNLHSLQDQEMQNRRQTLAMTQIMADARDTTRLDIARSSARVADLEAQRPGLIAATYAMANEIGGTPVLCLSTGLARNRARPCYRMSASELILCATAPIFRLPNASTIWPCKV